MVTKYSVNTYLLLYFVAIRMILVFRIATRYTKFRTHRAENILATYQINSKLTLLLFSLKSIYRKYHATMTLQAFTIAVVLMASLFYLVE